jgi:hypothetical protein
MIWAVIHYLCLLACLTAVVVFLMNGNKTTAYFLIGTMVMSVLTWVHAYYRRRAAKCPLCKGTPLLNSGALPHARAVRLLPLNHGVTATLSLLCNQEFRCMYCGNLYDLFKPTAAARKERSDAEETF